MRTQLRQCTCSKPNGTLVGFNGIPLSRSSGSSDTVSSWCTASKACVGIFSFSIPCILIVTDVLRWNDFAVIKITACIPLEVTCATIIAYRSAYLNCDFARK